MTQGRVTGPLLFLIFIYDLYDVIEYITRLFADDTKLYTNVESADAESGLQDNIFVACDCSASNWQLKFNEKRCKFLHIWDECPGNILFDPVT